MYGDRVSPGSGLEKVSDPLGCGGRRVMRSGDDVTGDRDRIESESRNRGRRRRRTLPERGPIDVSIERLEKVSETSLGLKSYSG